MAKDGLQRIARPTSAAASLHQFVHTKTRDWKDVFGTMVHGKVLDVQEAFAFPQPGITSKSRNGLQQTVDVPRSRRPPSALLAEAPGGRFPVAKQGSDHHTRPASAADARASRMSSAAHRRSVSAPSGTKTRGMEMTCADVWSESAPTSACWVSAPPRHMRDSPQNGSRRATSAPVARPVSRSDLRPTSAVASNVRMPRRPATPNAVTVEAKAQQEEPRIEHEGADENTLRQRLARAADISDAARHSCMQRLEDHLAQQARADSATPQEASQEVIATGSSSNVEGNGASGASFARAIQLGRGGNPGRHTTCASDTRDASTKQREAILDEVAEFPSSAAVAQEADEGKEKKDESEYAGVPFHSVASIVVEAMENRESVRAAGTVEEPKMWALPKKPKRKSVTFKAAKDQEEAARQLARDIEAMRATSPKNFSGQVWKRWPKHCICMREELCRSVFANFLESFHEELGLPTSKNPLNSFEERQLAALIKAGDSVGLVKYLAETEMHIKSGGKRSKVEPDAPLNSRIYKELSAERKEMAAAWGVQLQGLREERIVGLFMRGPFTWAALRKLLWEATALRPPEEDIHVVTDEEDRCYMERQLQLLDSQAKLGKSISRIDLKR